jgi:hypothetical protein
VKWFGQKFTWIPKQLISLEKLSDVKETIEKMIRGYIRQNVIEEPGCFPDNYVELSTIGKAAALAYWDHRTNNERKRDKRAEVTESDYVKWVLSELVEIKMKILFN